MMSEKTEIKKSTTGTTMNRPKEHNFSTTSESLFLVFKKISKLLDNDKSLLTQGFDDTDLKDRLRKSIDESIQQQLLKDDTNPDDPFVIDFEFKNQNGELRKLIITVALRRASQIIQPTVTKQLSLTHPIEEVSDEDNNVSMVVHEQVLTETGDFISTDFKPILQKQEADWKEI